MQDEIIPHATIPQTNLPGSPSGSANESRNPKPVNFRLNKLGNRAKCKGLGVRMDSNYGGGYWVILPTWSQRITDARNAYETNLRRDQTVQRLMRENDLDAKNRSHGLLGRAGTALNRYIATLLVTEMHPESDFIVERNGIEITIPAAEVATWDTTQCRKFLVEQFFPEIDLDGSSDNDAFDTEMMINLLSSAEAVAKEDNQLIAAALEEGLAMGKHYVITHDAERNYDA